MPAPSPSRPRLPRLVLASVALAAVLALGVAGSASASLSVLRPTPTSAATFYGNGGYSTDGSYPGQSIRADVPSGSTVVQAYLYTQYVGNGALPTTAQRTIPLDGTPVVTQWAGDVSPSGSTYLGSARADVTAQVATKVGGGGGITTFSVGSPAASGGLQGVALVVIYSNPGLPAVSIAVLDGAARPAGDTATIRLAGPLDKGVTGFRSTLALGIGFSYQSGSADHVCTGSQSSVVTVNGTKLTSCAGGSDDGSSSFLNTVGGVSDSTANPTDPNTTNSGTDDELYDVAPFLPQGSTQITLDTVNASSDDVIFLVVLDITARASVGIGNEVPPSVEPPAAPVLVADPPADSASTSRTISFAGDSTLAYECSLDGGAYAACTSPVTYGNLAAGTHSLQIRQSNGAGAGAPLTLTWTVAATAAPATTVPVACTSQRSVRLTWRVQKGTKAKRITVAINGKVYRRLSGSARGATVSLAGRVAGTYRVTVSATTGKRTLRTTRSYRTCVQGVGPVTMKRDIHLR